MLNNDKKILLITGATGFVGRNLLLHVLQDTTWSQIILPVRNEKKFHEQLKKEAIHFDPERIYLCKVEKNEWHLPSSLTPDLAIHCAGLTFSQERAPYFETNVIGTLELLKKLPTTTRLLVLSSQAAGGATPHDIKKRRQTDNDQPVSWYGESKLAMEKELLSLAAERLLILRPPMILGPRDTATLPLFKMAKSPLRVKPGFATKEYSWIDVDDLCEALLVAAKADWSRVAFPYYNLAYHQTITDRELLKTTASVVGRRGIILPLPHFIIRFISGLIYKIPALHQSCQNLGRDRMKEMLYHRWVMDSSAFERDFNWQATTSLDESLQKTAAWLATHKKQ